MNIIHPYPAKPSFEPLEEKRTFSSLWLGVELELEIESPNYLDECALIAHKIFNDFVILKEDGSLGVGFEICTRPASLELHKKMWTPFFDNGLKHFRLFKEVEDEVTGVRSNVESCGMHVHINRKPLSRLQIGKIVAFIHTSKNTKFIERVAGRHPNDFTRFDAGLTFRDAMHENYRTLSKHKGVNLHHATTIEIRIFKGTKDKEIFFKNLEFCDALAQFTLPSCTSIVDSQSTDKFMEFIQTEPCRYENLIQFLN